MLQIMSDNLAPTVDAVKGALLGGGLGLIVFSVCHLLLAWGLFAMARRRHVDRAWLAWIPVGNLWMLGLLSDQYRRINGQEMAARKGLMAVGAVVLVLLVVAGVLACTGITELVDRGAKVTISKEELEQLDNLTADAQTQALLGLMLESVMSDEALTAFVNTRMTVIGVLLGLACVASVVLAVLYYRGLYYVFLSCDPQGTKLFLLLSILLNLGPVLVFALRHQDKGIPHDKKGRLLLN